MTTALDPLGEPLLGWPGVGPKTAERLAEHGLRTPADALAFLPRGYDDLRALTTLAELAPGVAQVFEATVGKSRVGFGRRRFLQAALEDQGATIRALWFHVRSAPRALLEPGARVLVIGVPRGEPGALTIAHPELRATGGERPSGIRPRYPEIDDVPARTVEKLARAVCEARADLAPEIVPAALRARRGLIPLGAALRALHLPAPDADLAALQGGETPAHRRLAYGELFLHQLALAARRATRRSLQAAPCPPDPAALARFLAALPFAPTEAQRRAIHEIEVDLATPHPMHRLLHGEVGSGKTVVLFAAALQVVRAGRQAALLAPTALLAEQHARAMAPWAQAVGVGMALLTAATRRDERARLLAGCRDGTIGIALGTHALLEERAVFRDLALAIVDEQHRFGVSQRDALRDKGRAPHVLVASATPIPRSLALTLHGDLDLSVLDELPPGRTPVTTRLCLGARGRAEADRRLRAALAEGRQGYLVCPTVDEGGALDVAAATATCERLRAAHPGRAIGLCHGRQAPAERERTMASFRSGEIQLLVATTVIEVGVDVPAATLLIVEDADRFGLAQLHQLRGRIGRGPGEPAGECLLLSRAARGSDAAERLRVLERERDGFAIAEEDLRLRGPGDTGGDPGTRQSGLSRLRFADPIRHATLLREAREDARALWAEDPGLAHHPDTLAALRREFPEGALAGSG